MKLNNAKFLYIIGGIVVIYLIYLLAKCRRRDNYLQFSQGDETNLLTRLEGFKRSNADEHNYEDVLANTPNGLPYVQSSGTYSVGRYGSSFIV